MRRQYSTSQCEFEGVTAVVTGGCSGIGEQVARDLAARGAHVTICSHDHERLALACSRMTEAGLAVDTHVCDVRSTASVTSLAEQVLSRWGHVDLLINNAGYAVYRAFEESSVDENLDILNVNLGGAIRCSHVFLPPMIARRAGRIVNISSIAGETIITPNAMYCGAKHGMVAWSKAIRYELARFNVRVNVVCPGHTVTHFHDHPTFRRRDAYRGKRRSLSVQAVSAQILNAIRRDRVVTFVPAWQGLVAYALSVVPFLVQPVWDRINYTRINQLYEQIDQEKNGIG